LGLTVNGILSGPNPWHIHGDATITLLFFSVSASVDLTWGDSTQAKLPATPSDGTQFSIQSVSINSKPEATQTIQDYFAPGQFLTLNDADKLSKPAFE